MAGPLAAVMLSNKFKKVKNSIECELNAWSLIFGGAFLFVSLQTIIYDESKIWEIVTWIFVGLAITTCSFNFALGVKVVMDVVKSKQKNFALGSYNLFGHLLGDGISGVFIGWLSDMLAQKKDDIGKSGRTLGAAEVCMESAKDELSQGTEILKKSH